MRAQLPRAARAAALVAALFGVRAFLRSPVWPSDMDLTYARATGAAIGTALVAWAGFTILFAMLASLWARVSGPARE